NRLAALNRHQNDMMTPLIKIVRAWNQSVDSPLRGFHIECLVLQRYEGTGHPGPRVPSLLAAVSDFFAALPSLLERPCVDPVLNQRVDLYLDVGRRLGLRDRAIDKAVGASSLAGAAYDLFMHNRS